MKSIIILACIAYAVAVPVSPPAQPGPVRPKTVSSDSEIEIISSYNEQEIEGGYKYGFQTGAGYEREESGSVINAGTDEQSLDVKGSYKYTDAEGEIVEVQYTAGAGGFVPVGTNIPEIISNVARALSLAKSAAVNAKSKY